MRYQSTQIISEVRPLSILLNRWLEFHKIINRSVLIIMAISRHYYHLT